MRVGLNIALVILELYLVASGHGRPNLKPILAKTRRIIQVKVPRWLIVLALAFCILGWWHHSGNMPAWVPDWLQTSSPATDSESVEYQLSGGFPAASSRAVFKKLSALSQAQDPEAIQELRSQGLAWETVGGQSVRLISKNRGSKIVEVQNIGSFDSYWTYADALEK